jgi:hypothetical protein
LNKDSHWSDIVYFLQEKVSKLVTVFEVLKDAAQDLQENLATTQDNAEKQITVIPCCDAS